MLAQHTLLSQARTLTTRTKARWTSTADVAAVASIAIVQVILDWLGWTWEYGAGLQD